MSTVNPCGYFYSVTNPSFIEDVGSPSSKSELNEYADTDDKLIRISDLATYVKQRKESRTNNFSAEFEVFSFSKNFPQYFYAFVEIK